jgi:hypothetical protein
MPIGMGGAARQFGQQAPPPGGQSPYSGLMSGAQGSGLTNSGTNWLGTAIGGVTPEQVMDDWFKRQYGGTAAAMGSPGYYTSMEWAPYMEELNAIFNLGVPGIQGTNARFNAFDAMMQGAAGQPGQTVDVGRGLSNIFGADMNSVLGKTLRMGDAKTQSANTLQMLKSLLGASGVSPYVEDALLNAASFQAMEYMRQAAQRPGYNTQFVDFVRPQFGGF